MAKRPIRTARDNLQDDLFEPRYQVRAPKSVGAADFETRLRRAVSDALYEARMLRGRKRSQIAAEMAEWLGNPKFSEFMLNQYAAESNETHNINVKVFKALVKATGCLWLWDVLVEDDGCQILQGEEAVDAERGYIRRQMETLKKRDKVLASHVAVRMPRGRP